jgi:chromosome partitioning protein
MKKQFHKKAELLLFEKEFSFMGIVIGTVLEKGGVGKTTSTQALSVEFARQDPTNKVLAGDLDPQGNLTRGFGVQLEPEENSVYEVLLNPDYGIEYAVKQTSSGVYLLPSTKAMAGVELELVNAIARESRLNQALREAEGSGEYPVERQAVEDYTIFLDSPPNLGLLTMNVMATADVLFVPMQVQVYALDAMDQLEATIKLIRKVNKKAHIGGIFCTMFDPRTNLSGTIEKEVRKRYGSLVCETVIPVNIRLAEAPAFGKSIQEYSPDSPGAKAYAALAQEIKTRFP